MNTKKWYASRTLWVNALALLAAMAAAAETVFPVLSGLLPARLYAAIAFGLPIVNAALRVVTTQGLGK